MARLRKLFAAGLGAVSAVGVLYYSGETVVLQAAQKVVEEPPKLNEEPFSITKWDKNWDR